MAGNWTIGKIAKQTGINVQTVRYYERRRLLAPKGRRVSGYREYGEEEVRRLRFIRNAQGLGFTLQEIAGLLNLRVDATARCGDVQQRAQSHLHEVEVKIEDLSRMARALRGLIKSCRTGQSTDRCPILKSLEISLEASDGKKQKTR